MDTRNVADQLEKLDSLRQNNVITDEEFTRLKSKAISDSVTFPAPTVPASADQVKTGAGGGMTKITLGLMVVISTAVFFGVPLGNEDTDSECVALERAYTRVIADAQSGALGDRAAMANTFFGLLAQLSQGEGGAAIAKANHPSLPTFLGCTLGYWDLEWQTLKQIKSAGQPG